MKGFVQDIEGIAVRNDEFRRVLYTAKHCQLVVMTSSTIPTPTRRPITNTLTAKRRNSESTARQAGVTHQGDRS